MKVKNKIKQILSIIVTAMMMMSLFTVNAFANSTGVGSETSINETATKGKITITNPAKAPNAVYTAYKVLTANYVEGQSTYSYTVENAFKSIIDTEAAPNSDLTVKYTVKRTGKIVNKGTDTEANSYLLARDIEEVINTTGFDGTSQVLTSGTENELPIGYYAVLQTGSSDGDAWVATAPILAAVPAFGSSVDKFFYKQTIAPKGNEITIDKNIVQETVGTTDLQSNYSVKKDDASVGDILTYELKADVPHYTVEGSETGVPASYNESNIVFELLDTLSQGLTYKANVRALGHKVDGDNGEDITSQLIDVPVELTTDPTANTDLTFKFTGNYSNIKAYKYITITYQAKVNKNAIIGGDGNKNEVKLHYTVNPSKKTETNTDKKETVTYSYNVAIKKIDAANNEITTDSVEFELYRKVKDTYVLVKSLGKDSTNATIDSSTGKITFTGHATLTGLDAGEYKLTEVKAPNGYTLPANPDTCFTIVAGNTDGILNGTHTVTGTTVDTDKLTVKVTNTQGVTLPQTGGAGTWMFTIGGLVLMAGAVVVFMATRKKKAN